MPRLCSLDDKSREIVNLHPGKSIPPEVGHGQVDHQGEGQHQGGGQEACLHDGQPAGQVAHLIMRLLTLRHQPVLGVLLKRDLTWMVHLARVSQAQRVISLFRPNLRKSPDF